jgi:3-oxoacyl-[acyl-carrier-protein] synthase II
VVGDLIEARSVREVLGAEADHVALSATKSMTGHLLGAAGAVESIACILALQNQTVPPTINLDNIDPEIDVDVTPNVPKARPIEYALNNGFGFGGHNGCLIFRKAPAV